MSGLSGESVEHEPDDDEQHRRDQQQGQGGDHAPGRRAGRGLPDVLRARCRPGTGRRTG